MLFKGRVNKYLELRFPLYPERMRNWPEITGISFCKKTAKPTKIAVMP